jgi:hypothetical protein
MTGCPVPEVNPDLPFKLIVANGVTGLAAIGAVVTIRSKIAELRSSITKSIGIDVSGIPYRPSIDRQALLSYNVAARIYMWLMASIVGVIAAMTHSTIFVGDQKLLQQGMVCIGTAAVWLSMICVVISIVVVFRLVVYLQRLFRETEKTP